MCFHLKCAADFFGVEFSQLRLPSGRRKKVPGGGLSSSLASLAMLPAFPVLRDLTLDLGGNGLARDDVGNLELLANCWTARLRPSHWERLHHLRGEKNLKNCTAGHFQGRHLDTPRPLFRPSDYFFSRSTSPQIANLLQIYNEGRTQ